MGEIKIQNICKLLLFYTCFSLFFHFEFEQFFFFLHEKYRKQEKGPRWVILFHKGQQQGPIQDLRKFDAMQLVRKIATEFNNYSEYWQLYQSQL